MPRNPTLTPITCPRLSREIAKMKKCLTVSLSQKWSYAAALGHPNGSRRIGEVNGQPKKKSSVATVGPTKRRRKLVEVYDQDILYPTGIANVANNCYVSAIMQCLCSNPNMACVVDQLTASHPSHCNRECCISGEMKNYTFATCFILSHTDGSNMQPCST